MGFSNRLLDIWRGGGTAFGFWLTSPSAYAAEIVAETGPDWVGIDLQHGLIDHRDVTEIILAVHARGSVPLVRTGGQGFTEIGRVLDVGALGVIVPMVNNPAEAESVVRACRYPPRGARSYGPARTFFGTYDPRVVEQVACIVMIETPEGLARVEEIVAVPGVDGVLIGPSDLAFALGFGPEDRPPEHEAAVQRILDACRAQGVAAGLVMGDGAAARAMAARGFRFVGYGSDAGALASTSIRELAIARGSS